MINDLEKETRKVVVSNSITTKINQGRVLFSNYKSEPLIVETLTGLGYTDEVMAEGLALLNALEVSIGLRETTQAKQVDSSSELDDSLKLAHDKYMKYLDIARVIFKGNSEMENLLRLHGTRKRRYAYKIKEMKSFYENILREDILAEFVKYGKTVEMITADKALIDDVLACDSLQEKKKGELKLSVNDKQEAEAKYLDWMNKLVKLLKIEFRDNPDVLDELML